MIIKNVKIFGEDRVFTEGEAGVRDGRFVPVNEADGEVIDGEGCYMIPGLVDIHFHGCMGDDFCDADEEAIRRMAEYEASVGIDGELLAGSLPVKQLRLVQAWALIHEEELYKAWNKAVRNEPFGKIEPLR